MHLDPVLLSWLQFAWAIALHILLPAFTVGLVSHIALLEGLHLFTAREIYLRESPVSGLESLRSRSGWASSPAW